MEIKNRRPVSTFVLAFRSSSLAAILGGLVRIRTVGHGNRRICVLALIATILPWRFTDWRRTTAIHAAARRT